MKREKSSKNSKVGKMTDNSLMESEELFRRIFEDGPLGIALVDTNRKFFNVNDRFCKMLGYTEQELCNLTFMDVTHSESNEKDSIGVDRLMRGEIPFYKTDKQYIRKDGEIFWASLTVTVVRDSTGKHLYQVGMVEDITERKKTETKLKEAVRKALDEKTKTDTVLDAIGDAMSIQDTDYKVVYQNKRHKNILGNHTGEYCYKAYQGKDHICEGCHLTMSFKDGKVHTVERSRTTDKGIKYYLNTASPIRDSSGKIIAGIEMVREISEQKKAEKKIQTLAKFPDENPHPILRVTKDGEVIYANRGSMSLLNNWGCEIGQHLPGKWRRFAQDAFNEGSIQHAEIQYATAVLSLTFTPVTGSDYINIYGLDVTDRIHAMRALKVRSEELLDKVKELDCLYNILKLQVDKKYITLEEMMQKIIKFIPLSWQYPESTCAQITLEGQIFKTANFRETKWKQTNDIYVSGRKSGVLEICYLEEKPEIYEGPFLKEERNLINAVAEMIGKIIEQDMIEKELRKYREHLEDIVEERTDELLMSNVKLREEIAERNRAEKKLRFTQFSIDNVADAVFWMGPDARFIYVNETTTILLGYSEEELLTMSVHDINPAFPVEAWPAHWREVKERGSYTFESRIRAKDGRMIPVDITPNYMEFEGKEYSCAFVRDITGRKKREEIDQLQNDLSIALSGVTDLKEALNLVMNTVTLLDGIDCGGIYLVDAESGSLDLMCNKGLPASFVKYVLHYEKDSEHARLIMQGKPVYIEYSKLNIPKNDIENNEGLKGIAIVPIIHNKEVIACMNMSSHKFKNISVSNRNALETTASQVSSVISRLMAEDALKESQTRLQAIMDNTSAIIFMKDMEGRYIMVNRQYLEVNSLIGEAVIGRTDFEIYSREFADTIIKNELKVLQTEKPIQYEEELFFENQRQTYLASKFPMYNEQGKMFAICSISTDITERKKLEEQLLHSQKMESIGTLAGGVAHDFNNILTAIIGFANVLDSDMSEDDPSKFYVEQIQAAADTAANLTSSLLTFSRKQKINPTLVELNSIINRMEKLLFRIIGEDIDFRTEIADKRLYALVDFSQMQQVIMNLAINARDAMPEGGILTVKAESAVIDKEFIRSHGYGNPGEYAIISVSDTGSGFDDITKGKIFEPFFTSKEVGKGTGLGLSIVYGIIKQHNGYIDVRSAPGEGTTFRIYLPHIKKSEDVEEVLFKSSGPVSGTETILFAEDDASIRQLLTSVLAGKGYEVIVAEDGMDALNQFRENRESIDFVLLDVIMPGKRGTDVLKEIKEVKPNMKALFISGYSEELMQGKYVLEKGINIISKPLKPDELLRKIREILDQDELMSYT